MELSTIVYIIGITSILVYTWRSLNSLWFKPKKIEKFLREQGIKGSSYKFLFGDLKEMVEMKKETKSKPMSLCHDIAPRVSPFYHQILNTYGKNCFTWMGTKPVVHVWELTMIREVLNNYRQFQKLRSSNPLSKLLVQGVITAEGDQWVKHRKIINPAFHIEKLKHMGPAFYVSCIEMINNWEKLVSIERSCEVDVWPHLQNFSSDVISRTAFGSSFEEGRMIFELLREQGELLMKVLNSVYIPGSRFLPTNINRRMNKIDREVKSLITSIINKRVAAMKAGETSNDDLLGILLDSNYKEIKHHGNRKFGLSIDEVIEECRVFYFAGQETSGTMLVWTMILLGLHTKWQTQAREEVLRVFGDKKPDTDGSSHLTVINMILNEVLRLYPPVIELRRLVPNETKLGNLTIPAGTIVQINSMILHHDKDTWGEDVNEFKPERFSEGISKVTKGATYLPFGSGPRICIGQNFAMLEVKMALAMILQRFSFELSPSYSHAPHSILVVQPQFGAHLILHKL